MRLFQKFALIAGCSITAILLLVGLGLHDILHDYVMRDAEKSAVSLANGLRDCELRQLLARTTDSGFDIAPDKLDELDENMRAFLVAFDIVKIKMFNLDRRIVYSTDPTIIGKMDTNNADLAATLNGRVVSKFECKDDVCVWDLAEEKQPDIEVVETYVPLRSSDGRVVGSLEIYKDVTANIKEAKATLTAAVLLLSVVLAMVFGAMIWIMRKATTATERYQRQLQELNEGLDAEVKSRTESLLATRNAITFALANLAEHRDDDTADHLERVGAYCRILAGKLAHWEAFDPESIDELCLASSLHDIGKVGIPDAILRKPGKLTPQERAGIQQHPVVASQCLDSVRTRLANDDFLNLARDIARSHHERWDGGGYPDGLKMDEIPFTARILAVVDVYDALTSDRVYKDAMPHEKAIAIVTRGSGTQFDPMVVRALIACEGEFRAVRGTKHVAEPEPQLAYRP